MQTIFQIYKTLKTDISGRVLSLHQGVLKALTIDVRRWWIPDNWKWHLQQNGCLVNQEWGMAVKYSGSALRRCHLSNDGNGNKFEFIDTQWRRIDRRIQKDLAKVERRWNNL